MEKKSNKSLVFIIIVLILLLVGVSGYLVYDKMFSNDCELVHDNEDKEPVKQCEEVVEENISEGEREIPISQIKDYHNIYDVVYESIINNHHTCHVCGKGSDYFYSAESVNITNMDYNVLMSMVVEQYGNTFDTSISSEGLEGAFKRIFGDQIKYQTKDFEYGLFTYKYDKKSDSYIKHAIDGGGVSASSRENKVVKVMQTKDSIEVYDMVAFVGLKEDGSVGVYKDSKFKNAIATLSDSDQFNIEDYASKLNQYKYIFRLNEGGNYYFYSVELVK